jgi:hypothetical protein
VLCLKKDCQKYILEYFNKSIYTVSASNPVVYGNEIAN